MSGLYRGADTKIVLIGRERDPRWLWLRHRRSVIRGYVSSWQIDSTGRAWLELEAELLERMRFIR